MPEIGRVTNPMGSFQRLGAMPRTDDAYRGYRIAYLKDGQQAWIWPPGEALAMIEVQQRKDGETFDDLRRKAHLAIDTDINQRAAK